MITSAHLFPGAVVFEHRNCGFPTIGAKRRIVPTIHGVTHITGNSRLPSALAEIQFSAREGSGASFPFCVNRNGTAVQAFDPFLFAPWTNGDLNNPDTSNPFIREMVGSPFNANEFCLVTIENVGFEPDAPVTDAQIETNASIYAWAARVLGARSIEVDVVIGHRMINSVTRWNCPTRGDLLALRQRIVRRANELLEAQKEEDDMPTILRRVVGAEAVIRPGAEIRTAPRFGASVTSTVGENGRVEQVFAVVSGDAYGPSTDRTREWLVYVNRSGALRYFQARRADIQPIVGGDVADIQNELNKTKAALEASNALLAEKRALAPEIIELGRKVQA